LHTTCMWASVGHHPSAPLLHPKPPRPVPPTSRPSLPVSTARKNPGSVPRHRHPSLQTLRWCPSRHRLCPLGTWAATSGGALAPHRQQSTRDVAAEGLPWRGLLAACLLAVVLRKVKACPPNSPPGDTTLRGGRGPCPRSAILETS